MKTHMYTREYMHERTLKAIEASHQKQVKEKLKEVIEAILEASGNGNWECLVYVPLALRAEIMPAIREVFPGVDFIETRKGEYAQEYRVSWS